MTGRVRAAAAAGRFPRRAAAGVPAAGPDGGPQPPALVDLARGNAMLSTAAYPATVCDLAGRGYLSTEERGPGQVWCRAAGTPPPRSALTAFEQRVLRDADAALAGTGSRLGEIGQRSGSRGGRAVPGIGEEAWQLNRGRTVVFRLGPAYGKVTLSGPSEPRLVARLAATAATRLTVDDDNPASHPGRDRCPQPDMGCPSGDHGC